MLHSFLLFYVLGQQALGSEIINGNEAPENTLLYMASLQVNGRHKCGGFLVRKDFVMTAAHCDGDRVVLGTHNLHKSGKTVRHIVKRYRYPGYDGAGNGKDIMLLKLSREVQLGNSMQLAKLPRSAINIKDNEQCRVAGWGYTRTNGNVVDDLRVVDVSIINPQVCKREWPRLPANVICAGGYGTNKGFCQGDSGGPLECNGIVVGIVSFNNAYICDYPDFPNIYTDISKYLPWINQILRSKD
ncbi:mast cell protease 2 [Lates calcarifer]|uniref:trypsin n=1 Tax=Lates calcarifer TaxID=8187 RepID=A0AAJ7LHJ4_LATCA|nr:mast cell protease 2 [Lates calcarifer]